jgi:hypothetical protein
MAESKYLASLTPEQRKLLEKKLCDRQSGHCFICDDPIDLLLHAGQLEIDHIDPQAEDGLDAENNFAIAHASCNHRKGASDLRVARRLFEFERLQKEAHRTGRRGADLGDVLRCHEGAKWNLRLRQTEDTVEYSLPESGDNAIERARLYKDKLSGMKYFFVLLPIQYIHHDDHINPRSIGTNIRGLIEEFLKHRPQLHVSLAWWQGADHGAGPVKVFDGQHKAAAQILLGVTELPVRVFVEPDLNVLMTANTNAGSTLRQVAFDAAVMRHLGSTLYIERVQQYKSMRSIPENSYAFSEADLVRFFRGERREMERYIIDAHRDAITYSSDNRLMEFVEWSGKGAERPVAYSAVERTFFNQLLYKKALDSPIDEGIEQGTNPRQLERAQMIRLMSRFAEIFFVGSWDPEIGGRKIENRLQKGNIIPEEHLRAWRIAREEVLSNILRWVRLVMENYFAWTGQMLDSEKILHQQLPDELWRRVDNFLRNVSKLPCWIDRNLSNTVFGTKQSPAYWSTAFQTGITSTQIRVLAEPLDINRMIQAPNAT